jgi:hypothetical protein
MYRVCTLWVRVIGERLLTQYYEELVVMTIVHILRGFCLDCSFEEDRDDFWVCDDLWAYVSFRPSNLKFPNANVRSMIPSPWEHHDVKHKRPRVRIPM